MTTIESMTRRLGQLLEEASEAEVLGIEFGWTEDDDAGWLSLGWTEVRWTRDDDGDVSVRVTQGDTGEEVPTTAAPDDAEELRDVVRATARDSALWKDHLVESLCDGLSEWMGDQGVYWREWPDDEVFDECVAWQATWCDVLVQVYWAGGYPMWSVDNAPQEESRCGDVGEDSLGDVIEAMEGCVMVRE